LLTDRQRMILYAVIDDYIRSAEPVGSRTISKRGDIGFSPATIRNEMSDLEELGYLEQPHTSAGRIPSQKGYRYYVDHLIRSGNFNTEDLQLTKSFFIDRIMKTEKIMQQAATILSGLTNYTAVALGGDTFQEKLKHLQLIPLNGETAVAIIVTNTGHVENKVVSIPKDIPMNELEKFVNFLNAKLAGVSLVQLRSALYNEIGIQLAKHISRYEELVKMIESALESDVEEKLYLSGATNMLTQPEFKDVSKVKMIFDLFDESETLARMFADAPEGIQVRIGDENRLEAMSSCSVITATYMFDGQTVGTIGLIGPTRMEYAKVIGLLNRLSKDLTVLLNQWFHGKNS